MLLGHQSLLQKEGAPFVQFITALVSPDSQHIGKLSKTISRNSGRTKYEGTGSLSKKPRRVHQATAPMADTLSWCCSDALREAQPASLTVKHEIRLDKIFTWLFQRPFLYFFSLLLDHIDFVRKRMWVKNHKFPDVRKVTEAWLGRKGVRN